MQTSEALIVGVCSGSLKGFSLWGLGFFGVYRVDGLGFVSFIGLLRFIGFIYGAHMVYRV